MNFGRRRFVQLGMGAALSFHSNRWRDEGVSTHTAKPLARPKASGRPFNALFVDVAAAAGLNAPVIYGDPEIKKYIVESTGCGNVHEMGVEGTPGSFGPRQGLGR